MENKKFTIKQIADILGPYARDLVNQNHDMQNRIIAAEQLRDALSEAFDLVKNLDKLKGEFETLRKSVDAETATLKGLESRKAEMLGAIKPQQAQAAEREKLLASREQAVLAREEKVAQREDRARQIAGHLASFGETDS